MNLNFKPLLEAEYKSAKSSFKQQTELVRLARKNPKLLFLELSKYLEMAIMVKGNAWSMDIKSERRKMSKLVTEAVLKVL